MTTAEPPPVPMRAVWGRDFTLYFCGVVLSLTGFWVRFVAQGWLVYQLTDSPFLLGLVGFFTTLPIFIISPLAGVVVDRVSRRRMLAITQGGHMLIVLLLAILDTADVVTVWHVIVLSFLGGVVAAFDWPTRLSLVPNLVPPHLLPNAVALNSAAWNGARVGGPVVAGLLVPLIGTAGSFWVGALFFLPVLLAIPFIRVQSGAAKRATGDLLANLREGFAYIRGHRLLTTLLLLELVPIVFGQTFPNLMPVFAKDVLHQGPEALGWLMGSLGLGELIGTLGVAAITLVPRRALSALAGVILFGASMLLFALSRSLPLSMAFLLLAGVMAAGYSILLGTIVQTAVDDRYRGRVMSMYSMIWGLTPIGNLQLGAMAQVFGAPTAVFVNGLIIIAFGLVVLAVVPRLRTIGAGRPLAAATAARADETGGPP